MVGLIFNPKSCLTVAGGSVGLKSSVSTNLVPRQPGEHKEILSKKLKIQTNKKTENKSNKKE